MQQVPWLEKAEIEARARFLLDEYELFAGKATEIPVPVEAIIERFLGIRLEYDDLGEILGVPDVLGATWIDEHRMVIHSGLLDGSEGRIIFTCAHEVGHWTLHRHLFRHRDHSSHGKARGEPNIVCRKRDSKLRGEWQADYFAACLLMPEAPVQEAFCGCFGDEPLVMHNRKSCFGPKSFVLDPALDTAKVIAGHVIEAGGFKNVSREAMWYRLEELGLLLNRVHAF
jgi:hypothetical protein